MSKKLIKEQISGCFENIKDVVNSLDEANEEAEYEAMRYEAEYDDLWWEAIEEEKKKEKNGAKNKKKCSKILAE